MMGPASSPEFFRSHPHILFKYGGEVSRVIESHLFRNLVSQYGSVREKLLCPLDPFQVDEIRYGMSGLLLEGPAQIGGIHMHMSGKLLQGDRLL